MSAPPLPAGKHELAQRVPPGDDRDDDRDPQNRSRLFPRHSAEVAVEPQRERHDPSQVSFHPTSKSRLGSIRCG